MESHQYFSNETSKSISVDSLLYLGEYKLPKDEFMPQHSPQITFENTDKNSPATLTLLDHLTQRILTYNFETSELIESIDFNLVGDNGVGLSPSSFLRHSTDSLFILDKKSGYVSLINRAGILINQYNLVENGINAGFAFFR